jgi:hypothetical protein
VVGDFSEAMWQYEHFSETKSGGKQMADLQEVLNFCGLKDIGFSGLLWTYDNKKPGNRNVKVHLDRGVATSSWLNSFFDASITHLTSPCSYHCPLLLTVQQEKREKGGGRQVYFEIMWEREDSLGERIEQAWGQENTKSDLGVIHHVSKNTLQSLKQWSMAHFGSVRKEIERLRELLAEQQADVGQMKRPSRILSET